MSKTLRRKNSRRRIHDAAKVSSYKRFLGSLGEPVSSNAKRPNSAQSVSLRKSVQSSLAQSKEAVIARGENHKKDFSAGKQGNLRVIRYADSIMDLYDFFYGHRPMKRR